MTTDVERVEDTLERLRAELPETFTMEWLDNHRDDVLRAYEEYGPSRLAVSLSISVNSLKTWKQRRSLADRRDVAERRSETPAEDTGHTGVVLIPLDKIEANPWQTRKTIDPEDLQTLAESIDTSGLLQTPLGRRLESGVVQLAFGHRRVEAIRLLAEAGRWDGGAPVALRELTDLQMAVFAMEENAKRKDINHLEQLLGYQRVIQDGLLTVTELADTIGLARPTLSNNLRILYLTDTALEHFGAGDLSAHAARELVVFRSEDHRHDDDIDKVFARIKNPAYGAPDWSVKSVRSAIFDRVVHENKEAWRPLEKGVQSSYGIPNFDVDAFAKEFPTLVHHIPIGSGDGSKLWTCNVREWRRLQSAATRASTNKANSDPPAKLDKREETAYLGALANDPVVQSLKRGEPVADAPTDSVS